MSLSANQSTTGGRVFVCSGHMVDTPDRPEPRFPAFKEEAIRRRVAEQLDTWEVGPGDLALCGGARGADILFAELCFRRGATVRLCTPFESADFVARSVALPNSDWERRFKRLAKYAEHEVQSDALGPLPPAESPYARNNRWMWDSALTAAGDGGEIFVLLVWNEDQGDGPGGTSDFAKLAAEEPRVPDPVIINPNDVPALSRDLHFATLGRPKRMLTLDGGGVRGILTLQYLARIEKILEDQHGRPVRLSEYFDLIAGTSTGAIIAAALCLGLRVSEIEKKYQDLASRVFRRRLTRWGALRAKFDSKELEKALEDLLGDRTLDSDELETGLLIITKRLDTGSTWPLSNSPRAAYFHARPGSSSFPNGKYGLREVVRASTAAPHYFAPQPIPVDPTRVGKFVDGGASASNNPSLEALKLATLTGFGIGWPTGESDLLVVSCGTGQADPSEKASRLAGKHAVVALKSIMNDCAEQVETLMQWMSSGPTARVIDRAMGDLAGDLLSGQPLFTYRRYNVELDSEWVETELDLHVPRKEMAKLRDMDRPKTMDRLAELGRLSAEKHMDASHFPDVFKLA